MIIMGRPFLSNGVALVSQLQSSSALPLPVPLSMESKSSAKRVSESEPELEQDRAKLAESSAASAWSELLPGFGARAPDVTALSSEVRTKLAECWAQDALAEHASIASFARFTLQLMAVGAPPQLLADTQRAAADEVRELQAGSFSLRCCTTNRFVTRASASRWPLATLASLSSPLRSLSARRCPSSARWLRWR